MQVYFKHGDHLGNAFCAMRIIYNGQPTDYPLAKGDLKDYYQFKVFLKMLRFLYAKGVAKQPITILMSGRRDLGILGHLKAWQKQNWPLADKTSSEMAGSTDEDLLSKIPLNYKQVVPVFKEIAKALPYFSKLSFKHCDRTDRNYAQLTAYAKSLVKDAKPTKEFEEKTKYIKVAVSSDVLKALSAEADEQHTSVLNLASQALTENVKK